MPRGRQERGLRGYGRAMDVTFQTLDGRLPDSQEDLGLPLQFNCSSGGEGDRRPLRENNVSA